MKTVKAILRLLDLDKKETQYPGYEKKECDLIIKNGIAFNDLPVTFKPCNGDGHFPIKYIEVVAEDGKTECKKLEFEIVVMEAIQPAFASGMLEVKWE